jgi:hypothetical protein
MVNVNTAIFLEKVAQLKFAENFAILQTKKKNNSIGR